MLIGLNTIISDIYRERASKAFCLIRFLSCPIMFCPILHLSSFLLLFAFSSCSRQKSDTAMTFHLLLYMFNLMFDKRLTELCQQDFYCIVNFQKVFKYFFFSVAASCLKAYPKLSKLYLKRLKITSKKAAANSVLLSLADEERGGYGRWGGKVTVSEITE